MAIVRIDPKASKEVQAQQAQTMLDELRANVDRVNRMVIAKTQGSTLFNPKAKGRSVWVTDDGQVAVASLATQFRKSTTDPTAYVKVDSRGVLWRRMDVPWEDVSGVPVLPPAAHVLDGPQHTVSGLTAGDVLTALTVDTFGFAAPSGGGTGATKVERNLPLTEGSYVELGSYPITADSQTVVIGVTCGVSGYEFAKFYAVTVIKNQTAGAWKIVSPSKSSDTLAADVDLEVCVDSSVAKFRAVSKVVATP